MLHQHIREGFVTELKVEGSSMFPTIQQSQNVKIQPLETCLKINGIYLYNFRYKIIVHRLLKIDGNNCIFIGDNTSTIHHIRKDEILAKAQLDENRKYDQFVLLINRIFFNEKRNNILLNSIRTKLIRLSYLFTHWGKNERKI